MAGNQAFSTAHRYKCTNKGPNLIKTWFNQPARKIRRRQARVLKAQKLFPRPVDALRPVVTCCSLRYNLNRRAGKGFTPAELQAAGLSMDAARRLGISVDKRRVNKSQESIDRNVARLQEYQSKVTVFAKGTPKEEIKKAVQFKGAVMPVARSQAAIETGDISKQDVLPNVFETLRKERTAWRRAHRALLRAKAEAEGKK